jgi:hypothetical protein
MPALLILGLSREGDYRKDRTAGGLIGVFRGNDPPRRWLAFDAPGGGDFHPVTFVSNLAVSPAAEIMPAETPPRCQAGSD